MALRDVPKHVLVVLKAAKGFAVGNFRYHIEGEVRRCAAEVVGAVVGCRGDVFPIEEVDQLADDFVEASLEAAVFLAGVLQYRAVWLVSLDDWLVQVLF